MVSLLRLLLSLLLLLQVDFVDGLAVSSSSSTLPPKPPTPRQHDNHDNHNHHYDVIIIGGSFAGLSTALTLGRSNDDVLIIDSNQPCNVDQPLSYNFLTQDGISPTELLERAKADVMKYPTIQWFNGHATAIQDIGKENEESSTTETTTTAAATMTLFQVQVVKVDEHVAEEDSNTTTAETIEDNEEESRDDTDDESAQQHQQQQLLQTSFTCHKIVLATGVRDILPTHIPGLQECWGKSVLHCPYWYVYCIVLRCVSLFVWACVFAFVIIIACQTSHDVAVLFLTSLCHKFKSWI